MRERRSRRRSGLVIIQYFKGTESEKLRINSLNINNELVTLGFNMVFQIFRIWRST